MKANTQRSKYVKLLTGLAALLFIGYGASCVWLRSTPEASPFRTAQVERGNLDVTITATGTVEPEELIDVGAQVAGQISSLGKNAAGQQVDYGIEIEENAILAQIDDALFRSDVAVAEAQMKRAQADLLQFKAKERQAEADWKRAQSLGSSEALAKSSFDAYKAAYDAAVANVAVGEAAIAQADATRFKAERNLGYTTIKSPVKGVIIDRRVNIGQTVVASLNAPSLFLIAKDLKRMQVWVSVNEADIGSITVGQEVTFTVDAFPSRVFRGAVGKIRLNASMAQNVVTYVVEVNADNSDGTLLPYLTANVEFHVTHHKDVLLVPNAALRWSPAKTGGEKRSEPGVGGRTRLSTKTAEPAEGTTPREQIWVLNGQETPSAIAVTSGGSDGIFTEVSGDGLREGMEVVIGEERTSQAGGTSSGGTTNPFAPSFPRGGRRN